MANPHVESIQNEWARAFERWLDRAQRAVQESENGQYSPQRLLSDAIASSKDFTKAWCKPVEVVTAPYGPPVVELELSQADETATSATPIADPGEIKLAWSALGPGGEIPVDNIEATLSLDRRIVIVRLFDLGSLVPGTFEGDVFDSNDEETVVAHVKATVK